MPILRTGCLSFMRRTTELVSQFLVMNCRKASQSRMFPRLPIFFAELQAIKTSQSRFMVIPRSLEKQYSPGSLSSGDDMMSASGFGLLLTSKARSLATPQRSGPFWPTRRWRWYSHSRRHQYNFLHQLQPGAH
jgi:hypothetical protein